MAGLGLTSGMHHSKHHSGSTGSLNSGSRSRHYSIGLCAMDKKVEGKPMKELMKRMLQFGEFTFTKFGDETILNKPIQEWPTCDVLIAFFSDGFPLEKAEEYVKLHPHMFVLNDLEAQHWLFCRRTVYKKLKEYHIPVPKHVFCNRNETKWPDSDFQEFDDHIICDGEKINKPFVEKPMSGEDHNVYIYYPRSAGGGCKHLFRKVGDKSSEFFPDENNVRREGSYIYEEFMPTEGTDVKVYAVGPEYAHAEARKSPVVDGVVQRSEDGKEVRFPVMLTRKQKQMAHDVALAFKQTVCGFDLLVCGKQSFVCDVNGWSFVKNSQRFWDDTANTLRGIILSHFTTRHHRHKTKSFLSVHDAVKPVDRQIAEDEEGAGSDLGSEEGNTEVDESELLDEGDEELRCVIAIIRHGDRTPKQKMKMTFKIGGHCDALFDLLQGVSKPGKEVKLKAAKDLTAVLDITRKLLSDIERPKPLDANATEEERTARDEVIETLQRLETMRTVLEKGKFGGINRKVQIKPCKVDEETKKVTEAMLVLKWGGNLTLLGKEQAAQLGENFRHTAYPGESTGFLRLHNSYRHDLKIYSSDEGRVQMTAASFTKSFLDLEGDLTPILVSLVSRDRDAHSMLDPSGINVGKDLMEDVKQHLRQIMQRDEDITSSQQLGEAAPSMSSAIVNAIKAIQNPTRRLRQLHNSIGLLCREIDAHIQQQAKFMPADKLGRDPGDLVDLHDGETLRLLYNRWAKLYKDLYNSKKKEYDISKIPDVYDCAKYDAIHNQENLGLKELGKLYDVSRVLTEFIAPSEYGMTRRQKLDIGITICKNLLKKILTDLESTLPKKEQLESDDEGEQGLRLNMDYVENDFASKSIKTRLYFTSESHIHTILNVIRYSHLSPDASSSGSEGGPSRPKSQLISSKSQDQLSAIPEWDYLSRIIFRMYENKKLEEGHPKKFRIEIGISPGVCGDAIPNSDPHKLTRADSLNQASSYQLNKGVLAADRALKEPMWIGHPTDDGKLGIDTWFKEMRKVCASSGSSDNTGREGFHQNLCVSFTMDKDKAADSPSEAPQPSPTKTPTTVTPPPQVIPEEGV